MIIILFELVWEVSKMKRVLSVTTGIILSLFVIISSGHTEEVSIATIHYEPYYGEKLDNDGFLLEIAKESLKITVSASPCSNEKKRPSSSTSRKTNW